MRMKFLISFLSAVCLVSSVPAQAHENSTGNVIIGIIGGLVVSEIASNRHRERDRHDQRRYHSYDMRSGNWYEGPYDGRGVYIPSPPPVPESGNCIAVRTYNRHGGAVVRQFCN